MSSSFAKLAISGGGRGKTIDLPMIETNRGVDRWMTRREGVPSYGVLQHSFRSSHMLLLHFSTRIQKKRGSVERLIRGPSTIKGKKKKG